MEPCPLAQARPPKGRQCLRRAVAVAVASLVSGTSSADTSRPWCGTWTPDGVDGAKVFTIDAESVHWFEGELSMITESSDGELTTDLKLLGEGLHDHARLDGGKLVWDNGDVWVRHGVDGADDGQRSDDANAEKAAADADAEKDVKVQHEGGDADSEKAPRDINAEKATTTADVEVGDAESDKASSDATAEKATTNADVEVKHEVGDADSDKAASDATAEKATTNADVEVKHEAGDADSDKAASDATAEKEITDADAEKRVVGESPTVGGNIDGVGVPLASAEEVENKLHGLWTEKGAPGKHTYTFSAGMLEGEDLTPTPVKLSVDNTVLAKLHGESALGKLQENGEIRWEGDAGIWVRFASAEEMSNKFEGRSWTEKKRPGKRVFSIRGGLLEEDGVVPVRFTALADGTVGTIVSGKDATGKLQANAEINWEGGADDWVPLASAELLSMLEGKQWTSSDHPGKPLCTIADHMLRCDGADPVKVTVLADGTVITTVNGREVRGKLTHSGEIRWDDDAMWVALDAVAGELAKEWTEKDRPGQNVYLVKDGAVKGGDRLPAAFILAGDGSLETTFNGEPVKGFLQASGEIQWKDGRGTWIPWSGDKVLGALKGSWTRQSEPGKRIYTIEDGKLRAASSEAEEVTATASGSLSSTLNGKAILGQALFMDDTISWEGGEGTWVRWTDEQAMQAAAGIWTPEGSPGSAFYKVADGKLTQIGSDAAAADFEAKADGSVETTIDGKPVEGTMGDEVKFEGGTGSWVRWKPLHIVQGKWVLKEDPGSEVRVVRGDALRFEDTPTSTATVTEQEDGTLASTLGGKPVVGRLTPDGELQWSSDRADPKPDEVWIRYSEQAAADAALKKSEEELKLQRERLQVEVQAASRSIDLCTTEDVAWEPIDMPGTLMTYVKDAQECQQRCADTSGCFHFTLFRGDNSCHLQSNFAGILYGALGFASGPPSCNHKSGAKFDTSLITLEAQKCLRPGKSYFPLSRGSHGPEGTPTSAKSALHCQWRCQATSWCENFVYDTIVGVCHLLGKRSKSQQVDFLSMVSGPKFCHQTLVFRMELQHVNYSKILDEKLDEEFRQAVRYGISNFRTLVAKKMQKQGGAVNVSDVEEPFQDKDISFEPSKTGDAVNITVYIGKPENITEDEVETLISGKLMGLKASVLLSVKKRFEQLPGFTTGDVISIKDTEHTGMSLEGEDENGPDICADSPLGWMDSEGASCKSYQEQGLCTPDRGFGPNWDNETFGSFEDFAVLGRTAIQACCVCGGGTLNDFRNLPQKEKENSTIITFGQKLYSQQQLLLEIRSSASLLISVGGALFFLGVVSTAHRRCVPCLNRRRSVDVVNGCSVREVLHIMPDDIADCEVALLGESSLGHDRGFSVFADAIAEAR